MVCKDFHMEYYRLTNPSTLVFHSSSKPRLALAPPELSLGPFLRSPTLTMASLWCGAHHGTCPAPPFVPLSSLSLPPPQLSAPKRGPSTGDPVSMTDELEGFEPAKGVQGTVGIYTTLKSLPTGAWLRTEHSLFICWVTLGNSSYFCHPFFLL